MRHPIQQPHKPSRCEEALQALERELKVAHTDLKEHQTRIKTLEAELDATCSKVRSLEQALRRQQSEMRELDDLKHQLQAASQQSSEWQSKVLCVLEYGGHDCKS